MFFMAVCVVIVVYLFYNNMNNQNIVVNNRPSEKIVIKDTQRENVGGGFFGLSWPYTNLPSDPLLNPYSPPLRDERYFVPINVQTNIGAVPENTSYRQLGILTATNSKGSILPLMGRPVLTNRDKWQYYTMTNTGNLNTKLPISLNGKSCTNEYGCDDINNGDMVYVEGYKDTFRVTMYENNLFSYIPSL